MNWPTHSDYQDAMQNPGVCFQEPDLKAGEAKQDMLGLPRVMSGNFASVYELKCNDHRWAIRCFVRQVPGQQGRYARLCQYLSNVTLPYLVKFDYMLKGILVKGEWYPIVKMQWVEGMPLNSWVEENLNNPAALLKLAEDWRQMMKDLAQHKIAHGDLQHGNIMVTPENELRLVDYDGMYAPVFGRGRAPELGHINFQHPRRTADFYQEDLDNFSAIVIYTSLRALAAEPELWQKFYTIDNLVLASADFKNPLNSAAFAKLRESKDPIVQQLTKLLEKCCASPVENIPDFAEVMAAVDKGTVETMPMKTPAPAAPIQFSRPAPEATGSRPAPTPGSRPAPAVAATGSRPGTRSAYENAPAVATQPLKSRPAPAATKQPNYAMPPQQQSTGFPGWVWGVAGALTVGVIALIVVNFNSDSPAPESAEVTRTSRSETEEVVQPKMQPVRSTETATGAPVTPSPSLKVTTLGTLRGHSASVDVLGFSADGKMLASGSSDKTVRVWDVQNGQPKRTLNGSTDAIASVAFLKDGKTVAGVGADNVIRFWDPITGELRRKLDDYKDNLFPVVVSPEGNTVAAGVASDRKTVRVVDPFLGSAKNAFQHSSWVKSVNFSPDGKMVASTCHDESVNILDLTSGKVLHTLTIAGNTIEFPSFSKDNKMLATASDNRNVKVWDVKTGSVRQTFSGHAGDVKCSAFSPDGKLLATGGSDATVKIWDVQTGAEKQTLSGHVNAVTALAFSADGNLLATGGSDSAVKLWEIRR